MPSPPRKSLQIVLAFALGVASLHVVQLLLERTQAKQAQGVRALARAELVLSGHLAASRAPGSLAQFAFPTRGVVVTEEQVEKNSALPTLHIRIEDRDLREIHRALLEGHPVLNRAPGGNKPYKPARYIDETGRELEVEVGLRGLMRWHHHPEKPSLRIKIPKATATGQRFVELSRPKDLLAVRNWLPDQLGTSLGLMTAQSDHVRLFINGTYRGVYLRSRRANDALAMLNGRMPGAFFKDTAANLWSHAAYWNHDGTVTETSVRLFTRLLQSMKLSPSVSALKAVVSLVDSEMFARWSALAILTGSTHQDHLHNHILYFSHNRGVFEPLPWDVMGYGPGADPARSPNLLANPFVAWLMRDPRWIYRRDQILLGLLNGHGAAEKQIETLRAELVRMAPDLRADPYLGECIPRLGLACVLSQPEEIPREQERIESWIRQRTKYLRDYLADARASVAPHPEKAGWVRVFVYGNVAVRVVSSGGDDSARVLYPGFSKKPQWVALIAPYEPKVTYPYLVPAPLAYDVEGDAASVQLVNAVTGGPVTVGAKPREVELVSVHPSAFVEPALPEVITVGPGDVHLRKDLLVRANQRLIIRGGTTVRLDPNVSIVSRGQVAAVASEDAPIKFEAAGSEPWGVIALIGAASAGSRFAHVVVRGGAAVERERIQFKGMFNAYHTADLEIANSEFGPSVRGDDVVNVASSTFRITGSKWSDARFDALDVDQGKGVVEDCVFKRSGNDALDFMSSNVTIRNVRASGSGDKGLSVGERSTVVATDSVFEDGAIGVEVKDDSELTLRDSKLRGNGVGWHAYRKKWMYSVGGRGKAINVEFKDNTTADVDLEPTTSLVLQGSSVAKIKRGAELITRE